MANENIKLLIKNEYENGTSMSVLSKKYDVKVNTIKTWSYKEKWIKKKQNTTTKRRTTKTKKEQPIKMVVNDRKTKIKSEITNGTTREEIIRKYSITERTYYNYKKEVQEILIQQSEKILNEVAREKYSDIKKRLLDISQKKKDIEYEILEVTEKEQLQFLKQKLELLKIVEKDIKNNARVLSDYRIAELMQQNVENDFTNASIEIQKERLGIEREKLKKIDNTEKEKEEAMIELLKNINSKVVDKNE